MGSGEIKELKQENGQLHEEVSNRDESIERLQTIIREQQEQHRRELTEIQGKHVKELDETKKQVSRLAGMIEKACAWLPLLKELFRMKGLCRAVGFSAEQTARLVYGEKIEHSGMLYSEEHKRSFKAEKVIAQVFKNSGIDRSRLFLHVNGQSISNWFKEQLDKLRSTIDVKQGQKRDKGSDSKMLFY